MEHNYRKPAYEGDRILWVTDIQELTNSSNKTVYGWFADGVLPSVKLGGRRGCWESDFLEVTQPKSA
jgi:predicted DNA-binding transcriptional regulator AlpA